MNRHLAWQNCYNSRDLGGLPLKSGGFTRLRSIIRADILQRLTLQGQQELLDYGVRTILDLRRAAEVEEEATAVFPDPATAPAYLNLPLELHSAQIQRIIEQAGSLSDVYCLVLDHNHRAVASIMCAIVKAQEGGIVIHCNAGKDRTGIVVALLLNLAGVTTPAINADYLESEACLWPLYEQMVAAAGGEDKVDPWKKPTLNPQTIPSMLAHLRSIYGGTKAYLLETGLSEGEIGSLKQRLIGDETTVNRGTSIQI